MPTAAERLVALSALASPNTARAHLLSAEAGAVQVVATDVVVVLELEPKEIVLVDGRIGTGGRIILRRGDTWGVPVSVYADEAQTMPVDLVGSRLTFTMKTREDDADFVFQDTVLIDAQTVLPIVFRATEAASRAIAPGVYEADIERRGPDGLVVTGWRGVVIVEADITDNF